MNNIRIDIPYFLETRTNVLLDLHFHLPSSRRGVCIGIHCLIWRQFVGYYSLNSRRMDLLTDIVIAQWAVKGPMTQSSRRDSQFMVKGRDFRLSNRFIGVAGSWWNSNNIKTKQIFRQVKQYFLLYFYFYTYSISKCNQTSFRSVHY